jgi:REP element-mobilizing transposase RayT
LYFLELVGEMVERHSLQVHAYVLMDNHYHLLVRTPQANLSAALQWLNVAYSIWWNRRQGRVGPVFQGRFKAVVVESGEWVLACSLYIDLNPVAVAELNLTKEQKRAEAQGRQRASEGVRARRLERLRRYPWSSFRGHSGYGAPVRWLSQEEVLGRAGGAERYRKLAETKAGQNLEEGFWSQLRWGLVLGGESFARRMRQKLEVNRESAGRGALRERWSWAEVVELVERARGEQWAQFARRHGDPGLPLALYVARRRTGLTLRALGEAAGGMDYTAVSMAVKRFEAKLRRDKPLRELTERILQEQSGMKCEK